MYDRRERERCRDSGEVRGKEHETGVNPVEQFLVEVKLCVTKFSLSGSRHDNP